jgi:hypothetical protein
VKNESYEILENICKPNLGYIIKVYILQEIGSKWFRKNFSY